MAMTPPTAPLSAEQAQPQSASASNTTNSDCSPQSIGPWLKLVIVALSEAARRRPELRQFASVAIPARFVETIAQRLRTHGYETRIAPAYTAQSRMLTMWAPQPGMALREL